jgi:hypothetical protein
MLPAATAATAGLTGERERDEGQGKREDCCTQGDAADLH